MEEKNFLDGREEGFENEYIVEDITKIDHWLLLGIGILPFFVVTIWYVINY